MAFVVANRSALTTGANQSNRRAAIDSIFTGRNTSPILPRRCRSLRCDFSTPRVRGKRDQKGRPPTFTSPIVQRLTPPKRASADARVHLPTPPLPLPPRHASLDAGRPNPLRASRKPTSRRSHRSDSKPTPLRSITGPTSSLASKPVSSITSRPISRSSAPTFRARRPRITTRTRRRRRRTGRSRTRGPS